MVRKPMQAVLKADRACVIGEEEGRGGGERRSEGDIFGQRELRKIERDGAGGEGRGRE